MGCNGAIRADAYGLRDFFSILDFGKAAFQGGRFGAILHGGGFRDEFEISLAAYDFWLGFTACAQDLRGMDFRIAIGTNNCTTPARCGGSATGYDHGQAWALLVRRVDTSITWGQAVGAMDMEVDWGSPAAVRAWADGFSAQFGGYPYYYDFGDAQGCPTLDQGSTSRPCSNGWFQDDLWYVSWGSPAAYGFPQIYREDGAQAKQWQQISLYGYLGRSGEKISFRGGLSQWQACEDLLDPCATIKNTAAQSWTQLYEELASDPRTFPDRLGDMRWSTQMAWLERAAFPVAGTANVTETPAPTRTATPVQATRSTEFSRKKYPTEAELEEMRQRARAVETPFDFNRPRTPIPPERGIINESGDPGIGWPLFVGLNGWKEIVNGKLVEVNAGSWRDDPSQGAVKVLATAPDESNASPVETYQAPRKAGALRIIATDGFKLTLKAADGSLFFFDVPSRKWVSK